MSQEPSFMRFTWVIQCPQRPICKKTIRGWNSIVMRPDVLCDAQLTMQKDWRHNVSIIQTSNNLRKITCVCESSPVTMLPIARRAGVRTDISLDDSSATKFGTTPITGYNKSIIQPRISHGTENAINYRWMNPNRIAGLHLLTFFTVYALNTPEKQGRQ